METSCLESTLDMYRSVHKKARNVMREVSGHEILLPVSSVSKDANLKENERN